MMDDGPWIALWSEAGTWTQEEMYSKQVIAILHIVIYVKMIDWCPQNWYSSKYLMPVYLQSGCQKVLESIPAPAVTSSTEEDPGWMLIQNTLAMKKLFICVCQTEICQYHSFSAKLLTDLTFGRLCLAGVVNKKWIPTKHHWSETHHSPHSFIMCVCVCHTDVGIDTCADLMATDGGLCICRLKKVIRSDEEQLNTPFPL